MPRPNRREMYPDPGNTPGSKHPNTLAMATEMAAERKRKRLSRTTPLDVGSSLGSGDVVPSGSKLGKGRHLGRGR